MIKRPNRRTGKVVKCYTCSKDVYKTKSSLEAYDRHYCSKKCQNISPYKRKKSSEWAKKLNSTKEQKERGRLWGKSHIGKRPWNYVDGSSRNRKYTMKKWIKLAKECYKRDNWNCQECGKHGGLLNAHHILPWAGNPQLAFELNNLITLCVPCHSKIHNNK